MSNIRGMHMVSYPLTEGKEWFKDVSVEAAKMQELGYEVELQTHVAEGNYTAIIIGRER